MYIRTHLYIHIYIHIYTGVHCPIVVPLLPFPFLRSLPHLPFTYFHIHVSQTPLSTGPMASPIRTIIPGSIPTSVALGRSNTTAERHGLYLGDCNPHFGVMLLPVGKTYCRKHPIWPRDPYHRAHTYQPYTNEIIPRIRLILYLHFNVIGDILYNDNSVSFIALCNG